MEAQVYFSQTDGRELVAVIVAAIEISSWIVDIMLRVESDTL